MDELGAIAAAALFPQRTEAERVAWCQARRAKRLGQAEGVRFATMPDGRVIESIDRRTPDGKLVSLFDYRAILVLLSLGIASMLLGMLLKPSVMPQGEVRHQQAAGTEGVQGRVHGRAPNGLSGVLLRPTST